MPRPEYNGPKGHPVPPNQPDSKEDKLSQGANPDSAGLRPTSPRASKEVFHSHLHTVANDLWGHGVSDDFVSKYS